MIISFLMVAIRACIMLIVDIQFTSESQKHFCLRCKEQISRKRGGASLWEETIKVANY